MKLFLAITTLFAASAAAKYTPGQDCRTNKGCDDNCLGGKWSVVMEAGDVRMVCDPSTLDSTRYARASCVGYDLPDTVDKKAKTVCDNMKGKFCNDSCFLTTPASKEEDLTTRFKKACTEQKGSDGEPYSELVFVYPTKEQAVQWSNGKCDASVFSYP
ncbi:hypothetical protein N7536_004757 [Penicillium majusculum]|uniref:Uncharacterized protein n=1 Tax=Penicillium solitum TaxID=60172 RepID=A0A1V6QSH9_9EURO|nr:uncharacterized protein PENSOL_c044G02032 [Penicillium solitum]KAJ5694345.1 hypothetical protein N7536_004757 [Penicillium majusculum]OQD92180.1 hypothetical protein PENSOL_c044G02032 [Penicillium solitum]